MTRQALKHRAGIAAGFMLVELLVVMTIVGILAAIAIPSFAKYGELAEKSSIKQQLQQGLRTARAASAFSGSAFLQPCSDLAGQMAAIEPSLNVSELPSLLAPTSSGRVYKPKRSKRTKRKLRRARREKRLAATAMRPERA